MEFNFFDSDDLERELEKLPPDHQIAFAASCCERLFPFYQAFSTAENWGEPSIPRKALDKVWQILSGSSVEAMEIEILIEACCREGICPTDNDNFGSSSLFIEAGNCIYAICATLEACLSPHLPAFVKVAQNLKEAIEYYIGSFDKSFHENCTEASLDEAIEMFLGHPLVLQERIEQSENLRLLKESKTLNSSLIRGFRTASMKRGKMMIRMFENDSLQPELAAQPSVREGDNSSSWTPGFFERTAGAWIGEPLERGTQGQFDQRDWL